jgi:hypothetical protein
MELSDKKTSGPTIRLCFLWPFQRKMPPRHRAGKGSVRGFNAQDLCHPTSVFRLRTSDLRNTIFSTFIKLKLLAIKKLLFSLRWKILLYQPVNTAQLRSKP